MRIVNIDRKWLGKMLHYQREPPNHPDDRIAWQDGKLHCDLSMYWNKKLQKNLQMIGFQVPSGLDS